MPGIYPDLPDKGEGQPTAGTAAARAGRADGSAGLSAVFCALESTIFDIERNTTDKAILSVITSNRQAVRMMAKMLA